MFVLSQYLYRRWNVCVIGGGPAGISAALRAIDLKKEVCIIERSQIGGADLWEGALQSKTLWELSNFVQSMKEQLINIRDDLDTLLRVDYETIQAELRNVSNIKLKYLLHQLNSVNIPVIEGTASFVTENSVMVELKNGHKQEILADYFVLACGSKPRQHSTVVADGKVVFTSDDIMKQPLPKSIVILGAGVIGCEFASIFAKFGQTKVNMIEKSDRILPMEDEDISLAVQTLLQSRGVQIYHHSALESATTENGKFSYTISDFRDGSLTTHLVDAALVSIGREPSLAGLGLENIGVKLVNGRLVRDEFSRLESHKNIYACGDIGSKISLVNVSELEGRRCIEHIYKAYPLTDLSPTLSNVSTIMFLDVEVAAVGLNEKQCKELNIGYRMARYGYEYVNAAVIMKNTNGFVKIIVTNDEKMQVLGVRALGPQASSVIELASIAIYNRDSAYTLSELRTAYPSVTQGFQECLNMLLGSSIFKPNVFPQLIMKEWSPNLKRGRFYQEK